MRLFEFTIEIFGQSLHHYFPVTLAQLFMTKKTPWPVILPQALHCKHRFTSRELLYTTLLYNPATQGLRLASPGLAIQPSFFGTFGRPGRPSRFLYPSRTLNQFLQPLKGIITVLFPGTKFLCLDNNNSLPADTLVLQA